MELIKSEIRLVSLLKVRFIKRVFKVTMSK